MKKKTILLGMNHYTEDEADIFLGRRDLRDQLYLKLINNVSSVHLIGLKGDYGTGKTSFILACLFPLLKKMRSEYEWESYYVKPSGPFIIHVSDYESKFISNWVYNEIFITLKQLNDKRKKVLIVIDQFEDVKKLSEPEKTDLGLILQSVKMKSFGNIKILICYRNDFSDEIHQFFRSRCHFGGIDEHPMPDLEREEAIQIFRSILQSNNIGMNDSLLKSIVIDMEKVRSGKCYPLDLQIVASYIVETLKDSPETERCLTKKVYDKKFINVKKMTSDSLYSMLDSFGEPGTDKRTTAENILKELTRNGEKDYMDKNYLIPYSKRSEDEILPILDKLVELKLIKEIPKETYVLTFDCMAEKMYEKTSAEERSKMSIKRILKDKAINSTIKYPQLLEKSEMELLYINRNDIQPNVNQRELIFLSGLAGNGPMGWWLKDESAEQKKLLLKEALSSSDISIRRGAAILLHKMFSSIDSPSALHMLNNSDEDIEEMARSMLNDPDQEIKETALDIIGDIGIPSDIELLKLIFDQNHINPSIRRIIVKKMIILSTKGDFQTIRPIIMPLLKHDDENIKNIPIIEIGNRGTKEDIEIIEPMLSYNNVSNDTKRLIVEAIGKRGSKKNLTSIRKFLNDTDESLVIAAIKAIGALHSKADLSLVEERLYNSNTDVITAAIDTMSIIGTKRDIPKLKEMMKNRDEFVVMEAIKAIIRIGIKENYPVRKDLLDDRDPYVKKKTVEMLLAFGGEERLFMIREMLNNSNNDIKLLVIKNIGDIGTNTEVRDILPLIDSQNESILKAVIETIGKKGTSSDRDIVKTKLNDGPIGIKIKAIKTIAEYGDDKDVPVIANMLDDSDESVVKASIIAIGRIGKSDKIYLIERFLNHTNVVLKKSAIETIEKFGRAADIDLLMPLLNDSDASIKKLIIRAVAKILNRNNQPIIEKLSEYLEINDEILKIIKDDLSVMDLDVLLLKYNKKEITDIFNYILYLDNKFYPLKFW